MTFQVRDSHDGHPGMMARAYDQMIAVAAPGPAHRPPRCAIITGRRIGEPLSARPVPARLAFDGQAVRGHLRGEGKAITKNTAAARMESALQRPDAYGPPEGG